MRGFKVEDVMTPTVVVVQEDTPFKEVVRIMHEHRVSGVPVLDRDKELAGIVTEADLLAVEEEQAEPKHRRSFLEWFLVPTRAVEYGRRVENLVAEDIMTPSVVTADPQMRVPEAAKLMLDAAVKRLPVVDEDRTVLGIVSRSDLLRPYLRPDEEIEREIRDEVLVHTMWLERDAVGIEVDRGVVTLTGRVERRSVQEILVELIRRVDGVVGVEDELSFEWDDREARPTPPRSAPRWDENWIRREG